MKKNITKTKSTKQSGNKRNGSMTIGMDLGDKTSRHCVLNSKGEVEREAAVATTKKGMQEAFAKLPQCQVAMEVGTHSP